MPGGAYVALSGLRARFDQLDRLASDLANFQTAGYKAERTTHVALERASFEQVLRSAVDVATSAGKVDFRPGTVIPTGNELDVAIEGRGFFVIETPGGPRYTRDGHFTRRADGTVTTPDGFEVQGDGGAIQLPPGAVSIEPDGTIRAGGRAVGKLKVVDFQDYGGLYREGPSRFGEGSGADAEDVENVSVVGGSIEQSNVSMMERLAQLTEVSRTFEALQRGVSVLMNDVDGRAIAELGRR